MTISPTAARWITGGTLAGTAVLALPTSALFLDDLYPGSENLALGVAVATPLAVGTALGTIMPQIAGAGASRGRGAVVGALAGVGAVIAGGAFWGYMLGFRG